MISIDEAARITDPRLDRKPTGEQIDKARAEKMEDAINDLRLIDACEFVAEYNDKIGKAVHENTKDATEMGLCIMALLRDFLEPEVNKLVDCWEESYNTQNQLTRAERRYEYENGK